MPDDRPMPRWRTLALVTLMLVLTACTATVAGTAVRPAPGLDDDSRSPVDVDGVLLERSRMQAITGAGEDLTVIPSMDGKQPVDVDALARTQAAQCRWYFAETLTFGADVEEFHKTTYQDPPRGALISQAAAGYRDVPTARHALDELARLVADCAATSSGEALVGEATASGESLRMRTAACGRLYQVKSVVLVEVTYCRFAPTVPDIVMTNVLARIPG